MNCEICKKKEATNHLKNLHICDGCLIEIQLSFTYHIGGKEVTPQEYRRRINES